MGKKKCISVSENLLMIYLQLPKHTLGRFRDVLMEWGFELGLRDGQGIKYLASGL